MVLIGQALQAVVNDGWINPKCVYKNTEISVKLQKNISQFINLKYTTFKNEITMNGKKLHGVPYFDIL